MNAQQTLKFNNGKEDIAFQVSKEKFLVKFKGEDSKDIQKLSNNQFTEIFENMAIIKTLQLNDTDYTNSNESASKNKLSNKITNVQPVLIYNDGVEQVCNGELNIKTKSVVDFNLLLKVYNFTVKKDDFIANQFLIKIDNISTSELFALTTVLQKNKNIDFVEPNFTRFVKPQTADPLYGSQWAINNQGYLGGTVDADMDVDEAWNYSTGSGIKVAIIDEGVDLSHPDLIGNLLPGYDATGGNSNGAPSNDDAHGTGCAGIVAAVANNNIGTVGVAYNSKIIPIRIAFKNTNGSWQFSDNWASNGISFAVQNGADVLSNSWGGGSPSTTITNAINNAVTNGRSGKGCVVLFASGNNDGAVSFPATLPNVIAVGASSMCDQRKTPTSCDGEYWWGSNYGTGIDVIAPGVKIYTADISGSAGSNSGDYKSDFNGTSSACPNVAGVVALILSVKPSLTGAEARGYLETSTDKLASYSYSQNVAGQTNGTWNNEVGYGRVNALKAVSGILSLSIIGNSNICATANSLYSLSNPLNTNIIWTSTPNLTLTNQTNVSVNVIASSSSFSGEGTITATFPSGMSVTKPIWVGLPTTPTFLKGPATVTTGALVNYSGGISQGATSYEWWLPYPYDTVNTFDYFGQNWQKLTNYSDSNYIQVFTGYAQNSGLVQLMGKNACGCGGAKSIQVSHGSGGGGQIPRMANPEGTTWYTIYPNPSSDFVNIELRDQNNQPITKSKIIAELYDLMGHKKGKVEIVTTIAKINVAGLPKGVYVLNINIDGQIEGHQVIVE